MTTLAGWVLRKIGLAGRALKMRLLIGLKTRPSSFFFTELRCIFGTTLKARWCCMPSYDYDEDFVEEREERAILTLFCVTS